MRRKSPDVLTGARTVFVTEAVVTEVHHVASSAGQSQAPNAFLEAIAEDFYELVPISRADHALAAELIRRHQGQTRRKKRKPGSLDTADAMNVIAAA
ncbi:MAG: PIN domain-containing protein, partial [Bifidobacteriaceae bacterium]|nr:PIN domain-containing protein [Bifidobacteriaceae bacterium]